MNTGKHETKYGTIIIAAEDTPWGKAYAAYRDDDEPDDSGHMIYGRGQTAQAAYDELIAQLEEMS